MKAQRGCGLLPWLVAALGLLLLRPGLICAADATNHVSITLNAGESYVIDHVDPNSTPGVRVIENPHALVVHNEEAGKLVLLGAEAGKWNITVQSTTGKTVEYDVAVNRISNPLDINHPGKAPAAISGSGLTTGSAAPVEVKPTTTKLDSGAGPVTTAGASPAAVKKSPATVAAAEAPTAPVAAASPAAAPSPVAVSAAPAPMAAASPAPALPLPNPVAERQAQSVSTSVSDKFRTDPAIAANGGEYASVSVTGGRHYLPADTLDLMTGTSAVFDFRSRIRRVSIADTTVADLQVINPYQINLIAHKPGFTTLAVWNNQGQYQERQIRVDEGGKQQVMLNCIVAELDRSRIENQGANLAMAFPALGLSLVGLPGAVATPYSASSLQTMTTPLDTTKIAGPTLAPGGGVTPLLLSQSVTYGLSAQNSNVINQSFFQYLETHQLAKILAEPHLLANSGEVAKFLSGGEIPIVIAQALNSSIVFKEYGTSVQFLPTVVGRNEIELLVKPEVSAPDYTKGVQLFGFTVPSFVTRRAETLVRLHDNQTLIIAGLIEHNRVSNINKVPYLGDIPYLGGLFRTTGYTNTETDLVISVTPQIVRPLPANAQIYNPYDTPEMSSAQIRTKVLAQPDAARPRF